MKEPRKRYCFNCGEELGFYDPKFGDIDIEACGKEECLREERYARQSREAEARWAAEQDGYSLYGG